MSLLIAKGLTKRYGGVLALTTRAHPRSRRSARLARREWLGEIDAFQHSRGRQDAGPRFHRTRRRAARHRVAEGSAGGGHRHRASASGARTRLAGLGERVPRRGAVPRGALSESAAHSRARAAIARKPAAGLERRCRCGQPDRRRSATGRDRAGTRARAARADSRRTDRCARRSRSRKPDARRARPDGARHGGRLHLASHGGDRVAVRSRDGAVQRPRGRRVAGARPSG